MGPQPSMSIAITRERPDAPAAAALVRELEDHVEAGYPPESRHGFSVERLLAEDVHFFVLRQGGEAAACGGILFVDGEPAEIKRMYVRPAFRGRGFGRRLLEHLDAHARSQGIMVLRLQTGIHQREAIGLYEQVGFRRIPPFGPYTDDPLSVCYERRLGSDQ